MVASEVKSLAVQTARATEDISSQIHEVQVDGSTMVTCAGVNPTSTIQAVALHIADGMIRRRA